MHTRLKSRTYAELITGHKKIENMQEAWSLLSLRLVITFLEVVVRMRKDNTQRG